QSHDQQHIAMLTAQLNAARDALARVGAQMPGPYGVYQFAARSGAILTLGILSLAVCSIMGPIAWSMGSEELRRIDAGLTPPMGRSSAQAGRICGIISTSLLIIAGALFFFGFILAAGASHRY
ncbi:MAG TPA: hypothetical protein VMJ10_18355, partial [Kofleriaceae bacterium]|nr:hypothetical protein [Kofleriaceae bacterium]